MTTITSISPIACSSSTTANSAAISAGTSAWATPFCKLELPAAARPPAWSLPPEELGLANGDVHLWRFSLDRHDARAADFLDLLSADERVRAQNFFFVENRRRFIIARGWLRSILGRYLHTAPAQLAFRYGAQGKPYLASPGGAEPICFNLAHSDSLALVAVTRGRAVGVDVERLRAVTDADAMANRFFSRRERSELSAAPATSRAAKFLRVWTGKEACVKAVGRGLDDDLAQVDVAGFDDHAAKLIGVGDETGRISHCWLAEVFPADDHVAAVALVCDGLPAAMAAAG